MHVEGSLSPEEAALREPLYEALRLAEEPRIKNVIDEPVLRSIVAMEHDGENPTLGTARRLLRQGVTPQLAIQGAKNQKEWEAFAKDLKEVVDLTKQGKSEGEVEEILAQYFSSMPWAKFREEYRRSKVSLYICQTWSLVVRVFFFSRKLRKIDILLSKRLLSLSLGLMISCIYHVINTI
jgi:hypothetical protein